MLVVLVYHILVFSLCVGGDSDGGGCGVGGFGSESGGGDGLC